MGVAEERAARLAKYRKDTAARQTKMDDRRAATNVVRAERQRRYDQKGK